MKGPMSYEAFLERLRVIATGDRAPQPEPFVPAPTDRLQARKVRSAILGNYRAGARDRGLIYAMSDEAMEELFAQECAYCRRLPFRVRRAGTGVYLFNGVDRADSTRGYTPDNCVPCCTECNTMKRDQTREQFLAVARLITERAAQRAVTQVAA